MGVGALPRGTASAPLGNHIPGDHRPSGAWSRPLTFRNPSTGGHTQCQPCRAGRGLAGLISAPQQTMGRARCGKQECNPSPEGSGHGGGPSRPAGLSPRPGKSRHTGASEEQQGSEPASFQDHFPRSLSPASVRPCGAAGTTVSGKIAGLRGSPARAFPAPGRKEQRGVARPDQEGPDQRPVLAQSGHFCSPAPYLYPLEDPGPVLLLDSYLRFLSR